MTDGQKPVSAVRVPVYICPSERRDEVRVEDGNPKHYPLNYAVNLGKWFVYDPSTEEGGSGAFYPNSRLGTRHFDDGLSKTMMAAEVRAWQPHFRNAALPNDLKVPEKTTDVCAWGGAEFKQESGHTEWVDGRAHQTGFTTVFGPNSRVACRRGDVEYDIDWTNQQEGKSATVKTFAVVTARSYHTGVINVAMMDGSVEAVSDDIELKAWRAMSTRGGSDLRQQ